MACLRLRGADVRPGDRGDGAGNTDGDGMKKAQVVRRIKLRRCCANCARIEYGAGFLACSLDSDNVTWDS